MVFPVVMYGSESWIIKKTDSWRANAFKLWCCRILLRVPWTVSKSSQLILKEINPEYSLERQMLKAGVPINWAPDAKSWLSAKELVSGKIEGKRKRGWQRIRWLYNITDLVDMKLSKLLEIVKDREAWWAAVHGVAKSQVWLSDWTTATTGE